jgi:peptide/nickel transport system ATP-binding protein
LSILGLLPRNLVEVSGSILFRGRNLLTTPEAALQRIRGAEISLAFQEPEIALCPVMRVGQQITEILRAHKDWPASQCRTESEQMLARVGFPDPAGVAKRYPHQLSGGQRQRVLLAQALACGPALVLLDEPTTSLDALSQQELVSLLHQVKHETNAAILLINHAPEVHASLADRLVVMAEGQIIEQGGVRRLFTRPSDSRTRKLLTRNLQSGSDKVPSPQTSELQLI